MNAKVIRDRLAELKAGRRTLNAGQYAELLDAVADVVAALDAAPLGPEAFQNTLWKHHQRAPAFARLADALAPEAPSSLQELQSIERSDAAVARSLLAALESPPRPGRKPAARNPRDRRI